MLLLAKVKLNTIKVLIFKDLIYWYVNHKELISVNNVLRNIMTWKKQPEVLIIETYVLISLNYV